MDCAKAKEYLHPYIDGALPALARRELEQHLQSCQDCASELKRLQALSSALRSLPLADVPPGFSQALHERLAAEPRPRQLALMQRTWVRALAAAAMLVLVIGVVSLGGNALHKDNAAGGSGLYFGAGVRSAMESGAAPDAPLMPAPAPAQDMLMAEMPEAEVFYNHDYGVDDAAYKIAATAEPQLAAAISADMAVAVDEEMSYAEQPAGQRAAGGGNGAAEQRLERKIIRNANLSLKVADFSAAYQRLNELAVVYGGYVVSGDAYSYDGEKMLSGYVMLRVEAGRLDEALAEIESLGKVENRNISAQDISMEYYDIAGRLNQYQIQEKRLLEILAKAETVEDLITVERELTQVRAQLESLQGQLRYYDQMTALSSINVNLYQPDVNTQTVRLSGWPGLWQDIREGFISGVNALIRGLSSLIIGFARLLPLLLLIALVVIVLVLLIRSRLRR